MGSRVYAFYETAIQGISLCVTAGCYDTDFNQKSLFILIMNLCHILFSIHVHYTYNLFNCKNNFKRKCVSTQWDMLPL